MLCVVCELVCYVWCVMSWCVRCGVCELVCYVCGV